MATTPTSESSGRALGSARRATHWRGQTERRIRLGARWLSLTLVALALAVAVAVLILRPPASHVKQLALYLGLAGA
ncbi:MAG: hypothetical protein ACHQ4H_11125, partial [Ktedonobacterales bacterium]